MSERNSCSYHPTKPALYHCPKCLASFCPECISKRQQDVYAKSRQLFFCPKCNIPAEMLSVGSFIDPFWNRLPKFFVYPFHFKPLLLILLLSSATVFLSWIPFIHIILWGVLIKYSYAVLRNTAQGNLRPPDLSYEVIGEDFGQAFKQIGLFLIVGITLGVIFAQFGQGIGFLCVLFIILLMPAMIILLAISNSLINAVNPVAFVTLAYRIGWGYVLMYLFLALLLAAPVVLATSLPSFLSPKLWQFLANIANQYYTIISYNLMGYVILQYHESLGYEVSAEDFTDQSPVLKAESSSSAEIEGDAAEAILNQVNILIKDGRAEEAVMLMRDRMRGRAANRVLSERYYNLLKITQRTSEMLTHGIAHLDLLTSKNETAAACEIYRECLSQDPQFTPKPEALFKIAAWCTENGDAKIGLSSFIRFIKANPQHALAPKAHFLLAKNLYEKLRNPARAKQVLESLIEKYPNHDLSLHAGQYLEKMKKIGPASG